jgi:tripartite-type tricarboxylate transporter receptor subunit TctC
MKRVIYAIAGLAIAVGCGLPGDVSAAYPDRTVTIVVPFPPGGRTDLTTRIVAQNLEKHLGVAVAVVNKPGAGGVRGAKEVAAAKPDGYTLGVFSSAVVSAQYTVETPTNLADYKAIGLIEISPAALAVKADAPWKTLRDLVTYAKQNPKKIRMGMIPGASAQVFAGGFADAAGVELTMVPYKGDAPGVIALAGGHIETHVAVPASYKALIEGGKIRMLGVAAGQRLSLYRDVPTFKEQGVNLEIGSFHVLFAPVRTSDDVIENLAARFEKAMHDPEMKEQLTKANLEWAYRNRKDTATFLAGQNAAYKSLIQKLGLMYKKK